jgi:DNA-binding transcriptional LysR family regulator
LFIALARTHRLAHREHLHLQDLADEPFIGFTPGPNYYHANQISHLLISNGLQPKVVRRVDSEAALMNMVSVGIGICPAFAVDSDLAPAGIVFKPIVELDYSVVLQLVWRRDRVSAAARHFIDLVAEQMARADGADSRQP